MTLPQSRVFQAVESPHDLSAVAEFGEVIRLYKKGEHTAIFRTDEFSRSLAQRLRDKNFDASRDYVLVTGSILGVAMLIANVAAYYGKVKILVFDAVSEKYVPKTVSWEK